ncbi:MAG: hypothetical protein KGK11_03335 [Sphingomonadales bacterium]|nr:hypothetical protein [Sphingomonadales bacterium]
MAGRKRKNERTGAGLVALALAALVLAAPAAFASELVTDPSTPQYTASPASGEPARAQHPSAAPIAIAAAPPRAADAHGTIVWGTTIFGLGAGVALLFGTAGLAAGRRRPQLAYAYDIPAWTKAPPRAAQTLTPVAWPESATPPATEPVGDPSQWLLFELFPVRMELEFARLELRYRLRLTNRGPVPLGPMLLRACLAAGIANVNDGHAPAPGLESTPVRHYLDALAPGASAEVIGGIRLPRRRIAAMRLGKVDFFVPHVWLATASAEGSAQPFHIVSCHIIGAPTTAIGGLEPFWFDSKPLHWRRLVARELALALPLEEVAVEHPPEDRGQAQLVLDVAPAAG